MPLITGASILSCFVSAVCIVGVIMVGNTVILPITQKSYTNVKKSVRNKVYMFKSFSMSQSNKTLSIIKYINNNYSNYDRLINLSDSQGNNYEVPADQWIPVKIDSVDIMVRINSTNESDTFNQCGLITGVTIKCNKVRFKRTVFNSAVGKIIKIGNKV